MKYLGKVALVFGATGNIGSTIAIELARHGAAVSIHYNSNEGKAKLVATECNALYKQLKIKQKALIVKADARKKTEIKNAIDETAKSFKRIDFLVNVFTLPFDPKIWNEEDKTLIEKAYKDCFEIDVMGTRNAMELAFPYLKRIKGAIVNFSSSPVISGYSEGTAYSVAKSAIKQLTMDYAQKYGPYGIRINAVAPGWVPKGTEKAEELSIALNNTPLRQVGKPQYIAQVVCDILDWQHVTGQTIIVDGGEVMR